MRCFMARLQDATVQEHRPPSRADVQLQVALDNMPGALVYTDEALNIVICNDRFKEMYRVPEELLQPGRPYPDFLRYLAEHGYYGQAQFRVALANMPGALVYTDKDLNIVFCNDRFKEMYDAPRDLLQPGRPYPDFLRYLAVHGYYCEGAVY